MTLGRALRRPAAPASGASLGILADAEAVTRSLERAGLRPPGSAALELERGWPMPRLPLILRYRDPERSGRSRRWWSLHALPEGRWPLPYRLALKSGRAVLLDDLPALVQGFPDDAMLGHLPAVARSSGAGELASAAFPEDRDWDRVTARVVGYKPTRRCTVRYRFSREGERGRTVYGKCLPPGESARQEELYRILERTARRRGLRRLRTAKPGGSLPHREMVWWRKRAGRSLLELLPTDSGADAAVLAGRSLAELHASGAPWTSEHDAGRELATLRMWVAAATACFPGLAGGLQASERAVRRAAAAAGSGRLVPSHRDFYDKQLLVHGGALRLLDLETASRAEPELDVANFLAHLELRSLQRPGLRTERAAAAFLDSYSRSYGPPDPRRLAWYRAGSLLRLACVYAFRPQWRRLTDVLRLRSTRYS